ncbi:hypothetical protein MCOR19_005770 [Pyricularia oryzae]|nr:hypothetical protein MCOR19_005770 [Pyricularia oryzae]
MTISPNPIQPWSPMAASMRFFHIIVAALMATSGLAAPAPDGEVADTNTVADGKSESHAYKVLSGRKETG